jgi:hypothetical protein
MFWFLRIPSILADFDRKLDYIMAQDDDLTTAVASLQSEITAVTNDVQTVLADAATLLAEVAAGTTPVTDPKITAAISALNESASDLGTLDNQAKATLATITPSTAPPATQAKSVS